jgi:hypothetical protein
MRTSILLAAMMFGACATVRGSRGVRYDAPVIQVAATGPHIVAAITLLAREKNWQIVEVAKDGSYVEAIAPEENVGGALARDRWRFRIDERQIAVERTFEVQFYPGEAWQSAEQVCPTYAYVEERGLIDALGEELGGTTVVASYDPPEL